MPTVDQFLWLSLLQVDAPPAHQNDMGTTMPTCLLTLIYFLFLPHNF